MFIGVLLEASLLESNQALTTNHSSMSEKKRVYYRVTVSLQEIHCWLKLGIHIIGLDHIEELYLSSN